MLVYKKEGKEQDTLASAFSLRCSSTWAAIETRPEMQRFSPKGKRVVFMGPYLPRRVAQPKQGRRERLFESRSSSRAPCELPGRVS